MIARGKRRLAAALLLVFTAWPLAHIALVRAYDLNPWKFGGWAMYTTIPLLPKVQVFALRADAREELGVGSHAHPRSRAALEALAFDVHYWGELVDPGPLARAARDEFARGDPLEIVITRHFLDRESARVSARRDSHFFPAAEPASGGDREAP